MKFNHQLESLGIKNTWQIIDHGYRSRDRATLFVGDEILSILHPQLKSHYTWEEENLTCFVATLRHPNK
jgi:hypothetical protein